MKTLVQSIIAIASPMVFYFALLFLVVAIAIEVWSKSLDWGTVRIAGICLGVMLGCVGLLFCAKLPVKKALLAGLENTFWFV